MFNDYNDVVTVGELAKMIKVGRNTAYELVRSGAVKSIKVGRQIRVTKQSIIDLACAETTQDEIV
jgi:excisionase family DNA binding protein